MKNSYTLVELIMIISITIILLVLAIANYRSYERTLTLSNEAEKLVSFLAEAKSKALSRALTDREEFSAFGIHLSSPNSYFLFADTDGNLVYNNGDKIISSRTTQLIDLTSPFQDFTFLVPEGEIYFNGATSTEPVEITLTHQQTKETKIVHLSPLGAVEILK